MPEPTPEPIYDAVQEIRFALVLYGGVSLALYMNGVAQELFHMVRATAPKDETGGTALHVAQRDLRSTEALYREAAQRIGLKPGEPHDPRVRARFVVDIISGTSAGGVNGIYLGKALANDQRFERAAALWKDEADLAALINDAESSRGLPRQLKVKEPGSLLNGQRFYVKLLGALDEMDADPPPAKSPYVSELDVYLTVADLRGVTLPLWISNGRIDEQSHRKVFHFQYRGQPAAHERPNDFVPASNPLLAFAARCSSSVPVAFEPMRLSDIDVPLGALPRHDAAEGAGNARWKIYFREYPEGDELPYPRRPFADGGHLETQPFSHAIRALEQRHRQLPTARKLLYIEPAPEHPDQQPNLGGELDPLESAAAVFSIPRKETMRDAVRRLLERNRLVERLQRVTGQLEQDVRRQRSDRKDINKGPDWGSQGLEDMVALRGLGYGAYHRLKVGAVADTIAELIAAIAGINKGSDTFVAVTYLVRAWRDRTYVAYANDPERNGRLTQNRFLLDYDLDYRIRRLTFMLSKLALLAGGEETSDVLREEIGIGPRALTPEQRGQLRRALLRLHQELSLAQRTLRNTHAKLRDERGTFAQAVRALGLDAEELNALVMERPTHGGRSEAAERWVADRLERFKALAAVLAAEIQGTFITAASQCEAALGMAQGAPDLSTGEGIALRCAQHYYEFYEDYDMVSFPVLHCAGIGELETVDILRISPEEGPGRASEKLAGASFFQFGAFLDQRWRVNDILWGRLDGAERLLRALLPAGPERDDLIRRAQEAIVAEELDAPDPARRQAFVEGVVRGKQRVPGELAGEKAVGLLARSSVVVGKLLDRVASKYSVSNVLLTTLIRATRIFWALVEVALPRPINKIVFRYWITLLYALTGVLTIMGALFSTDLFSSGLKVLGVLAAAHLAVALVRDVIRQGALRRAVLLLVALAGGGLLGIGAFHLPADLHWVGEQARALAGRVREVLSLPAKSGS